MYKKKTELKIKQLNVHFRNVNLFINKGTPNTQHMHYAHEKKKKKQQKGSRNNNEW